MNARMHARMHALHACTCVHTPVDEAFFVALDCMWARCDTARIDPVECDAVVPANKCSIVGSEVEKRRDGNQSVLDRQFTSAYEAQGAIYPLFHLQQHQS